MIGFVSDGGRNGLGANAFTHKHRITYTCVLSPYIYIDKRGGKYIHTFVYIYHVLVYMYAHTNTYTCIY